MALKYQASFMFYLREPIAAVLVFIGLQVDPDQFQVFVGLH